MAIRASSPTSIQRSIGSAGAKRREKNSESSRPPTTVATAAASVARPMSGIH